MWYSSPMTVTVLGVEVDVEKLKSLRREKVLSIRELAEMAGVNRNTVYNLEHGSGNAHARTVRKLASALDIEPRELVR